MAFFEDWDFRSNKSETIKSLTIPILTDENYRKEY